MVILRMQLSAALIAALVVESARVASVFVILVLLGAAARERHVRMSARTMVGAMLVSVSVTRDTKVRAARRECAKRTVMATVCALSTLSAIAVKVGADQAALSRRVHVIAHLMERVLMVRATASSGFLVWRARLPTARTSAHTMGGVLR